MVKEIPLQNGMVALVDDEDYERCMEHSWLVRVKRTTFEVNRASKDSKRESLQQFVKREKARKGFSYSFTDKNTLNFQKDNLIELSNSKRNQNKKGNKKSSSKYKGVGWHKGMGKWKARIQVNGRDYHLGYFDNEDEAAKSYNTSALHHFGEDCYLNVIGEDNSALSITLEEAAKAYYEKAIELHGDEAILNFPNELLKGRK